MRQISISVAVRALMRLFRHEHLYQKIQENVILSAVFSDDISGTDRLLLDSKVILCTISMLSTTRVVIAGFTRLVPVETVIVDEASQIELGSYLPILVRFTRDMKKLVFIGDDKQRMLLGHFRARFSVFPLADFARDAQWLRMAKKSWAYWPAFLSSSICVGMLYFLIHNVSL